MTDVEQIYHKAQLLDTIRLQQLTDFLDFLLSKKPTVNTLANVFPETELESVDTPSVYQGKPLSLEDMDHAVEWQANNQS